MKIAYFLGILAVAAIPIPQMLISASMAASTIVDILEKVAMDNAKELEVIAKDAWLVAKGKGPQVEQAAHLAWNQRKSVILQLEQLRVLHAQRNQELMNWMQKNTKNALHDWDKGFPELASQLGI